MSFQLWPGDESSDADGRVRLMHHDARWRQEFEQTRSGILQSCEGRVVSVEHIGSTAISGIIARPVIDAVAIVADPVDLTDAALLIEGLNYRSVALPDWIPSSGPSKIALEKPRHGEATHRVVVAAQGSAMLEKAIRLRDNLRGNPEKAIEFEEAKLAVWRDCEGDPYAYSQAMTGVFAKFESGD